MAARICCLPGGRCSRLTPGQVVSPSDWLCSCLSVWLSFCLIVCPLVCLSGVLSARLSFCLPVWTFKSNGYMSVQLGVWVFVCLIFGLSEHVCVYHCINNLSFVDHYTRIICLSINHATAGICLCLWFLIICFGLSEIFFVLVYFLCCLCWDFLLMRPTVYAWKCHNRLSLLKSGIYLYYCIFISSC